MAHATLVKFGYPHNLVLELMHWVVLMRPQQVTLGSMVLAAKSDAGSFAALPHESYAELAIATKRIENALATFRKFDRINYLMLMMVDPHVHFHVLPRYATAQKFAGTNYPDSAWPGPPDLKSHFPAPPPLIEELRAAFDRARDA